MSGGGPTSTTTRPDWALGQCDRCGFHYRLNQLSQQIRDQRPTGLLVCDACNDVDQPQLQLGRIRVDDPQSLRNPRPDINRPASTGYFGWAPIGNPNVFISCQTGTITVEVS